MASDFEKMYSAANLRRAYRWLQSNPDANYKSYFRDAYTAYAAASQLHLRRLAREIARGAYESAHATKVFLPKPSGLLRPYTLLTVDDQIVYQACANIIAEKLKAKVKSRYNKNVFGHLYAGKASKFFYLKWQDGYRQYTNRVVKLIESGSKWVANFDLTAFYDSIDHKVLNTSLIRLGIEQELIEFLVNCLTKWSSTTWATEDAIYHGHGIPQGPLSSGLIAEAFLKYFDDTGIRSGASYLRYVDDIKIIAKTESQLRQRLVTLDLASKHVGVFPQSNKVDITEVKDPLTQIKSVSNPPEPSVYRKLANQPRLRKRLLELSRRGRILDKTRFKYLLSRAEPSSKLNTRLMTIIRQQPAMASSISHYIERYERIPAKLSSQIVSFLREQKIYHSVNAEFLNACRDNLGFDHRHSCSKYCESIVLRDKKAVKGPEPQPTLRAAAWRWLLNENSVSHALLTRALSNEPEQWVVKEMISGIDPSAYGAASTEKIMNWAVEHHTHDAARVAATTMVQDNYTVAIGTKVSDAARPILFVGRKLPKMGKPASRIHSVLCYVLDEKLLSIDWRILLAHHHDDAEKLAFNVKKYYESSIDGCILALDSLCDLIFERIYEIVRPGITRPSYGHAIKDAICTAAVPRTCIGFGDLHQLRIQSATAHPKHKSGAGRRLKYYEYYKVRPAMVAGMNELAVVYK